MTLIAKTPTIAIEGIDQHAVETYIRDLALLTLTNAEDWNLRFLRLGDQATGSMGIWSALRTRK